MTTVRVTAYAKVNLCLEVLGKRPDGFHEVRSVLQSISLCDSLTLESASELSLDCDFPHLVSDDNLVLRAARLLREIVGYSGGARISLRKGIPEAAGLGGASSDAASTLVGLARLWNAAVLPETLLELAGRLGSDVPFFLTGGTASVRGRGEIVASLRDASPRWLVLLVPKHSVPAKTATMYRLLQREDWTSGERCEGLVETINQRRPIATELLRNTFDAAAEMLIPAIGACRQAMMQAGAQSAHLSGAGPALFSPFDDARSARAVARLLSREGYCPYLARTLSARRASHQPSDREPR